MSALQKSTDTLQQLQELMLGDERRALAAMRDRLNALDAESVERLADDLAAALRRRRERGDHSFDELTAALQAATESAIQRSVTEDKSRLSKALYPIMGPAIRNYVVDLFRGMIKDLNETIRETTSAERLKWRIQAKLAGKPYSEFVLLKTRSFRIEEAYLMQRDTGLLLLHAARNPADEADDEVDLVSGMFTAIRSFVRDSFARNSTSGSDDDASELDSFVFGEREVLIEAGPALVLAGVAHGVPPSSAREELKVFLEELHVELAGRLQTFSGDTADLESGRPILRRALLENRVEAGASGGGGMWRVWLLLGMLAAGMAAWMVASAREQARWDRFENELRAEPGVAVTAVESDGWWGRRRVVRGLRDPAAADPARILAEHRIAPDTVRFEFGLMTSLEPVFAEARKTRENDERNQLLTAIEKLRSELGVVAASAAEGKAMSPRIEKALDAIQSGIADAKAMSPRFEKELDATRDSIAEGQTKSRLLVESLFRGLLADVGGLTITFSSSGDAVALSGALSAADLARVRARTEPLSRLLKVDSSGLSDATAAALGRLRATIAATFIRYEGGSLEEGDQQTFRKLASLVGELDRTGRELGRDFTFEILAHPLIGANRDANRVIEKSRANRVKEALTESGIPGSRLLPKLSEDAAMAGEGVSLRVIETAVKEETQR
jgi:OOP family OmpA-OmpF porin